MSVSLEKAIELMLKSVSPLSSEKVEIIKANGRILAEDVTANIDLPPFNRSPLDGYAVIAADTQGASKENPAKLTVVNKIYAGCFPDKPIKNGEAARIMTGAPMPEGSDCVVAQENTNYGNETVEIYIPHKSKQNFSFQGEDIKKGAVVIKAGVKLKYAHQGVLASIGAPNVMAFRKPRIALFLTGDELAPLEAPLPKGKIYNSNLYLLAPRLEELGISPEWVTYSPDDYRRLSSLIMEASKSVDLIITTGGVSVGEKDILHETLEYLKAEIIFKGLDLKPGSPAIFSLYNNVPVLSLSGNPFAAITTFELLARPLLFKLGEDPALQLSSSTGIFRDSFNKKSPVRRFIRGYLLNKSVFIPHSDSKDVHSSMMIGSLFDCNCLVDIEAGNTGLSPGDKVKVIVLN